MRTARIRSSTAFYRSLEAYKATFRNKSDVLVLDPSAEFFQYFKQHGSGRAPKPRGEVAVGDGSGDAAWESLRIACALVLTRLEGLLPFVAPRLVARHVPAA